MNDKERQAHNLELAMECGPMSGEWFVVRGNGHWGRGATIGEAMVNMPTSSIAYDKLQVDVVVGAIRVWVDGMGTLCWEGADVQHERMPVSREDLIENLRAETYRRLMDAEKLMRQLRCLEGDEQPDEHDSVVLINRVADTWCCETEDA